MREKPQCPSGRRPHTKRCQKCGRIKEMARFAVTRANPDGKSSRCRECSNKRGAQFRAENPHYGREWAARNAEALRDYHKQYYRAHRSTTLERRARSRRDHPDRYAAHRATTKAISRGALVRQPCEFCGATEDVHAHHEDYARPLDVHWLCRSCHGRLHNGSLPRPASWNLSILSAETHTPCRDRGHSGFLDFSPSPPHTGLAFPYTLAPAQGATAVWRPNILCLLASQAVRRDSLRASTSVHVLIASTLSLCSNALHVRYDVFRCQPVTFRCWQPGCISAGPAPKAR